MHDFACILYIHIIFLVCKVYKNIRNDYICIYIRIKYRGKQQQKKKKTQKKPHILTIF